MTTLARIDLCMVTILLLCVSNLFMTFAWYGHLKYFHDKPLWVTILLSWGIAFFEYCLMVPANRLGYGKFSGYELKIIQEVITLVVFVVFAWRVLDEELRGESVVSGDGGLLCVWIQPIDALGQLTFPFIVGQRGRLI